MTNMETVSFNRNQPPGEKSTFRVLLALSNLDEARLLLPFGESLVLEPKGELHILHLHTVAEGEPLSNVASAASDFRAALGDMMAEMLTIAARIKTKVRVQTEIWDEIWETVDQEDIDLLVVGWPGTGSVEMTVEALAHPRLEFPSCAVVAVHPGEDVVAASGWKDVRHILMPVRGGMNSSLTLRVGYNLAQDFNATITLLHVASAANQDDQYQFKDNFSPAMYGLERIQRTVTSKGDIPEAILQEAQNHQVVVMGAPSRPYSSGGWSGPLLDRVLSRTQGALIIVMEKRPFPVPLDEDVGSLPGELDTPVAVVVDKWFAENTFRSREFADLQRLLSLKEEQGLTISLGLPALNEEETVGNVIRTIKKALMEEIPFLDEIMLIDSGSTDRTRQIAADLGIPVHIHQEILPEHGSFEGKGEALWKSLYVLKGDIIAWIDTDIKNIHPRFVYGIVGPLLRDAHIQYVKGFYRRPLKEGDRMVVGGGGRVTELTARPFFNLFFPELSGVIQPLSGEYAGRRSVLERMPFFIGYGVETGLLLDLLNEYGLGAIAQSDLLERVHHNQPLPSLSKMSFAIMQVVFSRLEGRHNTRLLVDANRSMNLIRYGKRRRFYLEPVEICEEERPPMITLPEYREKRGISHYAPDAADDCIPPKGVGA